MKKYLYLIFLIANNFLEICFCRDTCRYISFFLATMDFYPQGLQSFGSWHWNFLGRDFSDLRIINCRTLKLKLRYFLGINILKKPPRTSLIMFCIFENFKLLKISISFLPNIKIRVFIICFLLRKIFFQWYVFPLTLHRKYHKQGQGKRNQVPLRLVFNGWGGL